MTTVHDLYELLRRGATGGATAIRVTTRLLPAGGPSDKVFPPTYAGKGGSVYATEPRVTDEDKPTDTVLLDSVQSQANRMEAALKTWWEEDPERLPMLTVSVKRRDRLTVVTALDAPHRAADAIFRDSTFRGVKFRDSEIGREFVTSRPDDATGLFGICPTALLFGQWDSTGNAGTAGAKFQRVIVSEVVGFGAVQGKRTSSRIDPLQIESVEIAVEKDGSWTVASNKKGVKNAKRPSEVNHGNVAPSVSELGGFSIRYAEQTAVISFPALRRLRFPTADGKRSAERDVAARAAVAAIGLHALALLREEGFDLRSRCLLSPDKGMAEFLGASTGDVTPFELDSGVTAEVVRKAIGEARKHGLPWRGGEIRLEPSAELQRLVEASDDAQAGEG